MWHKQFWEVLIGVQNDNNSKIIRFSCFAVLILGIIWAGWNAFKAYKIADTKIDFDFGDSVQVSPVTGKNKAFDKIVAVAQSVKEMRQGGDAIANSLAEMNIRPFNIETEGFETLNKTLTDNGSISSDKQLQKIQETLYVRAIMISEKSGFAVIDIGNARGVIVRKGSKLPNEFGSVVKIKPDGIVIRKNKQEIFYIIN